MEQLQKRNIFAIAQDWGFRLISENFGTYRLYRHSREKHALYDEVYVADSYEDIFRYLTFYEESQKLIRPRY